MRMCVLILDAKNGESVRIAKVRWSQVPELGGWEELLNALAPHGAEGAGGGTVR